MTAQAGRLALPPTIRACLFDLDGVLTPTAQVHAAAWKATLDAFLGEQGGPFMPFGADDYGRYVDGRPRADGVRSFLAARGISMPEGDPGDPPTAQSVHGLGNRKNDLVLSLLEEGGVEAYPGSLDFVRAARDEGLACAVVSASTNCREVLAAAGIDSLFAVEVDGLVAEREGLRGKPAPDTFLAAAGALDVAPSDAAVFEDALAGVAAGRAGAFGLVVGVDRAGRAAELRAHGADVVVSDLAELLA
jgi:beta-phosphoglucomutase family hydrolase